MRAFVMKGIGKVGFAEKPIPTPGPTDAIVKTTKALICTSDVHTVNGAIGPRDNLTLGHEAVGIVHQVGAAVKRFKPGDQVLVGAITPEWGDAASQAGHSSQSGAALGGWKFANIKDGVFAEYFHVNEADANIGAYPVDRRRRRRGLLLRHDLDRLDGGRERRHSSWRHGRGVRAWPSRTDGGRGGADARCGTDHRR